MDFIKYFFYHSYAFIRVRGSINVNFWLLLMLYFWLNKEGGQKAWKYAYVIYEWPLRKLRWLCPMFIILLACQTLDQVFKLICQLRFLFQHWTRKHVQNYWVILSIFGKNFIETFSETGLKPSLVSKSQSSPAKPNVWADPAGSTQINQNYPNLNLILGWVGPQ